MRFLDYIVNLFLIFWRISILFSLIDAPIYISTDRAQGFLFSVSFPTHFLFCVFDNIHPNICEVISHCGFDLHFTDYWWCWVPFQVTVGHLYVFIEKKKSTHLFCPFFNWVFRSFFLQCNWVAWVPCIFWISMSYQIFANILFCSIGYQTTMELVVFFALQMNKQDRKRHHGYKEQRCLPEEGGGGRMDKIGEED